MLFYLVAFGLGLGLGVMVSSKIIPGIFPYQVLILEERANSYYPILDRARVVTDKKGITRMQLFKEKKRIGAIDYNNIHIMGSAGAGLAILHAPERGELAPVKFDPDTTELQTINRDQRYLNILDAEEEALQFSDKSFIEKYGFLISAGLVFIFLIIFFIYASEALVAMNLQGAAIVEQQGMFNQLIADQLGIGTGAGSNVPPAP